MARCVVVSRIDRRGSNQIARQRYRREQTQHRSTGSDTVTDYLHHRRHSTATVPHAADSSA